MTEPVQKPRGTVVKRTADWAVEHRGSLTKWISGGATGAATLTLLLFIANKHLDQVESLTSQVNKQAADIAEIRHSTDADQAQWRLLQDQQGDLNRLKAEVAVWTKMAEQGLGERKIVIYWGGEGEGLLPMLPPLPPDKLEESVKQSGFEKLAEEIKRSKEETPEEFRLRLMQQQQLYDNMPQQGSPKQ
jgi:hypothetical protein